jgi:hypothetical protein
VLKKLEPDRTIFSVPVNKMLIKGYHVEKLYLNHIDLNSSILASEILTEIDPGA